MMEWSGKTIDFTAKELGADITNGLTREEVERRLSEYGENKFEKEVEFGLLERIAKQLFNPLVMILLIAGVIAVVLNEFLDATVIFVALLINIVIGVFQEERASKAFDKLRSSQHHETTVIRSGKKMVIPIEEVVPGDLISLESGAYVPADIRITKTGGLEINEAALTGEWIGVEKNTAPINKELPIAEQKNMAWRGTLVSGGFGEGVVVATGGETQIGKIAKELTGRVNIKTPIQRNVRRLAIFLSYLVVTVVSVIFVLGIVRGETISDMLLIAIAVAVSVVPEGLPVAVTIVLALGMERILDHGGLVRNLLAAETLGGTTVILTDKTGTITEARMVLDEVIAPKSHISASELYEKGEGTDALIALEGAVKASDAFIEEGLADDSEEGVEAAVRGRPMERAIVLAGYKAGIIDGKGPEEGRIDFLAFESERRYAASLDSVQGSKNNRIYFSGSPELLVEKAVKVVSGGKAVKMTEKIRKELFGAIEKAGSEGSRTLAVGYKDVSENKISEGDGKLIEGIVFAGILVFSDPIRSDVIESIQKAKDAGAHVVMLTGDNPQTAGTIAREAGIAGPNEKVITGKDIETMEDSELIEALETSNVFARVLPNQKVRIAKVLRSTNEVVAMTGDGINDAPALRNADIGVAVGSGTEVAKEASDLILIGDSFSIIVAAIEEGRRIIDNLKKMISHLLSTSFHEVFLITLAILFGLPLPFLPAQILWANIIEEGMLNFGFAFEPGEPGLMKRDPRSQRVRNVLTKEVKQLIFIAGLITSAFSILLYLFLLSLDLPIEEVRTIMFVVLSLDSIFFAVSLKHLRQPFWTVNFFSNRYLLFALGASILMLIATLSVPALRTLLSLTVLHPFEFLILAFVGAFNLATIEFAKYITFERKKDAEEAVI